AEEAGVREDAHPLEAVEVIVVPGVAGLRVAGDVEVRLHPRERVADREARLVALLGAEAARLPELALADHQSRGARGGHGAGRLALRDVGEAARLRVLGPLDAVVAADLVRLDLDGLAVLLLLVEQEVE